MNTDLIKTSFAAGLLSVLSASAAHAQIVPLTAPPNGFTATTTVPYALNNGFIQGPFSSALGTTTATFTATGATSATQNSFETFINSTANGTPLAFSVNTIVLDTFDGGDGSTHTPTGPLDISFSSPLSSFGLNVESSRVDTSTFSFTAYDGAVAPQNVIGAFTYAPVTQTPNSPQSLFIGAQAFGPNKITSIIISSISNANGYTAGSNDFYFGPLSTYAAPVPEASTTVSLGLLLMLGLGGAVLSVHRKTAARALTV